MDQQTLVPIENFIFDGVSQRLSRCFNCYVQYSDAENKTLEFEKIRKKQVKFPYLFHNLISVQSIDDMYNNGVLARKGIWVNRESYNVRSSVRLLYTRFEMQATYYTNRDAGTDSVLFFMRRWLFARRLGYLKFNVNYGNTKLACHIELSESVNHPTQPSEMDAMPVYAVESTFTVLGYMSEPAQVTRPVLTKIKTATYVGDNTMVKPEIKDYYWNIKK